MTREEILSAIHTQLRVTYGQSTAERTMSSISGTLDELDALPPYPNESDFQSQLSDVVYPFLAAVQAMDSEDTSMITELAKELFPIRPV